MKTARLDPRYRELFAAHASPEAIDVHLRTARADLRRLERHIEWMEELHARRTAERKAGTWPTAREEQR